MVLDLVLTEIELQKLNERERFFGHLCPPCYHQATEKVLLWFLFILRGTREITVRKCVTFYNGGGS